MENLEKTMRNDKCLYDKLGWQMVQVSGTPHQKPSYLGRPFSSINYWSTCSLRTNVNYKNGCTFVKLKFFLGIKEQSSPSSHHHESTRALTSAPVPPVRNWKVLEFRGTKMLAANRTTHKKNTKHIMLGCSIFWDAEFMANKHCDQLPLHSQEQLSWYRMCNRRLREPKRPLDISKKLQREQRQTAGKERPSSKHGNV